MPLIDEAQTALPFDYFTGSTRPAVPLPVEASDGVIGAAFRQNNVLVSAATNLTMKVENDVRDPTYSAWKDISGTAYEPYWERFAESNNPDYTAALKSQIDMENDDRNTLAASGWAGTFAGFGAALLDPTILIPGVGVVGKAGQGYKLGRMALAGAATGAIGTAAQEIGLQASQETRTLEESAINIGAGTVLGGLLGSAAYALLSPAERAVAAKAYDRLGGFDREPANLSAAAVDTLSREDLSTSGRVSGFIARATGALNPNLRALNRASTRAREIQMSLLENVVGVRANERGIAVAPGGAAETDARRMVGERFGGFVKEAGQIYREMKKAGMNMSRADFNAAVGRAARRGDQAEDGNMYVTRAAQNLRAKVLEPFRQDLINAAILPEGADITTALSYFPKLRNTSKLVAEGTEWIRRVTDHYAQKVLPEAFGKAQESHAARIATLRQQIADLQLDAPSRLRTLKDIEAAGVALDEANIENIDLLSRINELERSKEPAARAEAKRLRAEGGQSLKDYLRQRTDLRRRRRSVDFGIAGMEARVEALRQRLTDIEDENQRALATLVKRGQVFERVNQKWDADKIEQSLNDLTDRFEEMVRKSDRSEQKAREAVEKMRQKVADKRQKLRDQERDFAAQAKVAKKNDPMAKPALDQKAYEAQQKRLELEIAADERELEMLEKIATTQANYAEKIGSLHARMEAVAALDPEARIAEARAVNEAMIRERSSTTLARGERAQRLMERMDQLDPEKVRARVKALEEKAAQLENDFVGKWGDGADFAGHAAQIARDAYNKIIGFDAAGEVPDLPEFSTPITRGPMKERLLDIPDELEEDFLESDVGEVVGRYSRVVAGSVALRKQLQRLGFKNPAAMRDAIKAEYEDMRQAVEAAKTSAEAREILGRSPGLADNFRAWLGKDNAEATKKQMLEWLHNDMQDAVDDTNAAVEMLLGTYKLKENNEGFGRLVQRASMFNYSRLSGNFGISALSDLYGAAFAHGVRPFLQEGVAPLLRNLDALRLQDEETDLAGLAIERATNHRLYTAGELADPYMQGTAVDRTLRNLSALATKLNGVAFMQDIGEIVNSRLTQNRILKNAASGKDDEFLAKLGLGANERARIAEQFAKHGQIDGKVYIARSSEWDDAYAKDAFHNALNKAAATYVVRPGMGDLPLFARTPLGRALFQFRSFSFAAHQRTMLRAMQEGPGAIVRGAVGTTAVGMMVSWLAALRSGAEGYDRWRRQAENPGWWIAEGFDRGGFMPLLFEVANTTEKLSGTLAGQTFNPIKTTAGLPFGGAAYGGESSRNLGRSPMSALLGPTFGLIDTVPRALGGAVSLMQGEDAKASQARAAQSLVPLVNTMPVAREVLQMLTGDSPYIQ